MPKGLRYGALSEEFFSAHVAPDDGGVADPALSASAKDLLETIKERLENESAQWAFLAQVERSSLLGRGRMRKMIPGSSM